MKKPLLLEDAVREAALQNFQCDVKRKLCRSSEWKQMKASYEEEARYLLTETGENYLPEFNEPHIVLL